MNLVQIQERLKDAPVQAIMQYANGMNPMVPPYLALAELKRRESMNQGAQAQQAMQQGKQPSVKEQIEQSAGLAGLQQRMQQQGLQSLMAQQRPEGIPEGVPQPERQPEAEGIQNLPVSNQFNFKEGGIIPFARGDLVKGSEDPEEQQRRRDQERARQLAAQTGMSLEEAWAALKDIATLPGRGILGALETGVTRPLRAAGLNIPYLPASTYGGDASSMTPYMDALRRQRQESGESGYAEKEAARARAITPSAEAPRTAAPQLLPSAMDQAQFKLTGDYQSALADVMAIRDPAERAAAFQALRRTQPPQGVAQAERLQGLPTPQGLPSPAGQPMQGGISAIPGSDEAMQMMQESMRGKLTPQQTYDKYQELRGLYGLKDQYGEERMKRIQQMEAARQQELEGRGMERLMRVLGGMAGQGLKGAGTAYLQSVDAERTADAAFRKQMDELMGGVEEKRRAEAVSGMTEAQKQIQEQQKRALESAGKIMDADTQFKLQELQRKAVLGRLSAEEEYIRGEILKGRKYPEIKEEIARAGSLKEELKDTDLQKWAIQEAIKAWGEPLKQNPNKLPQDEWVRQKAAEIYKLHKGMSGVTAKGFGATEGLGATNPIFSKADAILAGGK